MTSPIYGYMSGYGSKLGSSKDSESQSLLDIINSSKKSGSSATRATSLSDIRAEIGGLLANVPYDGGKLTFADVSAYRDQLQEGFEAALKLDLAGLGVDTDAEFTLNYDAAKDAVTCDGEYAKTIQNYFAANDDMRAAFAEIVAYSNLAAPSQSTYSTAQLKAELQASALSYWLDNDSTASWFSTSGNLALSQAGSSYYSLDIRV